MKANQRGVGIILNYLTEGIRVLTVLLVTPVMLRLLGRQEYGLYQMATSVVSYLSLLNFGFGNAYVRWYAKSLVKGDTEEEPRLNGMFLLIFGALALVCLLCGMGIARRTELVFGENLSSGELGTAGKLVQILTVTLSLTLIGCIFDSQITAREHFLFQKMMRLLQALLTPLLTLPLLYKGHGAQHVAMVSLVLTAASWAGNGVYCRNCLNMRFSFRNMQISRLREIWGFTFFIFLNQIIDQINWSVDKFLLGRMCGTAAVAVYGIGAQINTLYMHLSTAVSSVFLPKVNRIAAGTSDNRQLSELLSQVGTFQALVAGLVLSGFLLFGRPFLSLWAGEGYEQAYEVALLLMVPMTVPLMQNLGIEILRARKRHRTRSLVCAALAVGNILLSIRWIPRFGTVGAAAGTAASILLGNVLFMNWYYQRHMQLDMKRFWRSIGALVPGWLIAIPLGKLLQRLLVPNSWPSLIAGAALYAGIYCAVLGSLCLKKADRQSLRQCFRKIE